MRSASLARHGALPHRCWIRFRDRCRPSFDLGPTLSGFPELRAPYSLHVDAVEQHRELRGIQHHGLRVRRERREAKAPALEPLVRDHKAAAMPVQNLAAVSSPPEEDKQMPAVRVRQPSARTSPSRPSWPRRMSTGSVANQTWTLAGKITLGLPSRAREQPSPGGRHHLRLDRSGLELPGRAIRPLRAPRGGLGIRQPHEAGAAAEGAQESAGGAPAWPWAHSSRRPREPGRIQSIVATPR